MIKSIDLLQVPEMLLLPKWGHCLIYFYEKELLNGDHYNSNVHFDGFVGKKYEGRFILP